MTSERDPGGGRGGGGRRSRLRASRLLQVLLLFALWGFGELFARLTHLPLPGSIVGFALLLVLLGSRGLDVRDVEKGSGFLLAQMLLFFVPAVVAIVDHREWVGPLGLRLLAAIVAGTVLVMLATGFVVEACCRWLLPERSPR